MDEKYVQIVKEIEKQAREVETYQARKTQVVTELVEMKAQLKKFAETIKAFESRIDRQILVMDSTVTIKEGKARLKSGFSDECASKVYECMKNGTHFSVKDMQQFLKNDSYSFVYMVKKKIEKFPKVKIDNNKKIYYEGD